VLNICRHWGVNTCVRTCSLSWVELSWTYGFDPHLCQTERRPLSLESTPSFSPSTTQARTVSLQFWHEWPLFFHWFHWLTTIIFHDPLTLTPCLKPSFSANPSQRSHVFLLQEWLHGFPSLFTDISEHIRFYFLVFLPLFSCWVPCSRLSWLMSAFTLK